MSMWRIILAAVALALILAPLIFQPITIILDPFHGAAGSGRLELPRGRVVAPGVPGEAYISWDELGVPTIEATTDEAGAYALGLVSASLRLFQMDLYRRIPMGNLSGLVGIGGRSNDVLMRTLNFDDIIVESWRALKELDEPDARLAVSMIESFARGVNDYISSLSWRDLPAEYRLLRTSPEPWSPEDVVAIQRFFAIVLALDYDDLILNELVLRWGMDVVEDLDFAERRRTTPQARCNMTVSWSALGLSAFDAPPSGGVADFMRSAISWPIPLGSGASNSWVVAASLSASGKPIVANDPHLPLTAPSLWLPVKVKTPSFKVAGVTIPGSPFVVIGRNERVAWSFTNVMGDFVDFYYYRWNGSDQYYYKDSILTVKKRVEKLYIWMPQYGRARVEEIVVSETVHGPLIEARDQRFAIAFTAARPSLELLFIMKLNKARSVKEALEAQRYFVAPVQNFVVADADGNIAYSPVGAFPVRTNLKKYGPFVNKGMLPFNGSEGEGEWAGFLPYSELPILYNPPTPLIITANSKPFDGKCGSHIGWHWADRFRLDRIADLLDAYAPGGVSMEEVMKVQTDSSADLSMLTYIRLLLELHPNAPAELKQWVAKGAPTDPDRWEPALALAWIFEFHSSLWERLYGSRKELTFFRIENAEALLEAYLRGEQRTLKYLGDAREMASRSLMRAERMLASFFKTEDKEKWKYGRFLYFHPTNPIVKAIEHSRVAGSGGPYSVSPAFPAEVSEKGAPVRNGASVRLVSDLSTDVLYISLPGGISGDPRAQYYESLLPLWAQGRYHKISLSS